MRIFGVVFAFSFSRANVMTGAISCGSLQMLQLQNLSNSGKSCNIMIVQYYDRAIL